MTHRFTLDGDAGLERRLFGLCNNPNGHGHNYPNIHAHADRHANQHRDRHGDEYPDRHGYQYAHQHCNHWGCHRHRCY